MGIELFWANGEPVGINIVLACTALQSMIVFVGPILVLNIEWRRRLRALLFTVPVIHVLNVFRNAGIIWLHTSYREWEFLGLSMFDFGHTYAARVGSLFAMFLMAIVMFEVLPELHKHVIRLMRPITETFASKKKSKPQN